jgi:hypothetical protein
MTERSLQVTYRKASFPPCWYSGKASCALLLMFLRSRLVLTYHSIMDFSSAELIRTRASPDPSRFSEYQAFRKG